MSKTEQNLKIIETKVVEQPRYEVIAKLLRDRRKGISKPLKLPSEEALAVKHNVARDTIRRALKVLEGHPCDAK